MGTRGADRIARTDADQLLAGQPVGRSHAGLAALLSEAAAPPHAEELAGEAEAVAAFRRLRSAAPSIVDGSGVDTGRGARHRHRIAGPPWRGAAVRFAVVALLLAAAGTASVALVYRPASNHPSPTQTPSSSVPTPDPSPSTPGTRQAPGSPATPSPVPSPASFGAQAGDQALAAELCQVWTSATDDVAREQAAAQLKVLMARLGGPNGLPAFCRKFVSAQPTGTTSQAKVKVDRSAAPSSPATSARPAAGATPAARATPAAAAAPKAARPTSTRNAKKGG